MNIKLIIRLLAAFPVIVAGCVQPSGNEVVPEDIETPVKMPAGIMEVEKDDNNWEILSVEIAATPYFHEKGMMFRESLGENEGMLFVFYRQGLRTFWMKNTLIPLDIIFIDNHGIIVGIIHNAKPLSLDPLSVGKPSRYVLEVNGGWSRARGVSEGNSVRFTNIPGINPLSAKPADK